MFTCMSVGVGGGEEAEPVVRKESLQTITVLLLSTGQQAGDSSVTDGVSALWYCWLGSWPLLHSALIFSVWKMEFPELGNNFMPILLMLIM